MYVCLDGIIIITTIIIIRSSSSSSSSKVREYFSQYKEWLWLRLPIVKEIFLLS